MAATTTTRRPQHRRGGSMKTPRTNKTIMKTTASTTTMTTTKSTNGNRIRPSDPRLQLSLRAFHQILPKKKRPHQRQVDSSSALSYGAHGDIFALLAAAAAAAATTSTTTSTSTAQPIPSPTSSTPTPPPCSADLGPSLYDPSSPWGVRDILYDPAMPLPQGVASSVYGPTRTTTHSVLTNGRLSQLSQLPPTVPPTVLPTVPPLPPNWQPRKARFFGPGLREALRLIPSEIPVRVQVPVPMPQPPLPSTPHDTPAIKQDPHATEQNGFLTDKRFALAALPVSAIPEAPAVPAAPTAPTAPMTPATTNGKRRRKPSMKAQLMSAAMTKPVTRVATPIVAPIVTPTVTPIHPPIPPTTPSIRPPNHGHGRCCPTEVPMILHMILDQTGNSLKPHMVDQYREHVGSLCADHLAKYRRLKESIGQTGTHLVNGASSLAPATTPKTPIAAKAVPPSSKRKKTAASTVAGTTPIAPPKSTTLPPSIPPINGRPVVNFARDDMYRRLMRDEIERRFDPAGAETTHGGVTNRVIYNLLGVAKQPNADPTKGPLDVHLLSGEEARDMLDAGSPHEPVVTQHEQMFQWRPQLRPIAELFRRMENLDRRVSVQVPSRHCMDDSFESRDLIQVRDRFLASEGKEEEDPWNILDLRSPLPAAVLPRFLTNENCQLLPRLRDEVLNPSRAERDTAAREQWNEWRDVLEWVLLSQGGHNTSPHTDSHGLGTWITVQEGLFGFGWLSHPTTDDRAAWTARPHEFTGGKWCFMVLEPGQTVFFNSGTVHFVFRLRSQATLALGGHVLQWSGIERWLAVVAAQMQNPHITNEDMEWSAPRYVRVVARLVAARLQSGRGVDDMGGEAAVRNLLALLHDFDERYLKDKPGGPGTKKAKRKKHRASHKK
ncbi:hypothetical protein SBRCBS47491_000777 [Sporothrix bragantina]|uniref:JmjC domain-containing protein n=1 Tax=Sporothrix bragantina TaxID=671064 RepID=A0ABP0AT31_9PEZI